VGVCLIEYILRQRNAVVLGLLTLTLVAACRPGC
jgi:hypothetical protein